MSWELREQAYEAGCVCVCVCVYGYVVDRQEGEFSGKTEDLMGPGGRHLPV